MPARARHLLALAALVCFALLLVLRAVDATAGTYTFYSCRTPAGGAASMGDWVISTPYPSLDTTHNSCPRGPFALEMRGKKTHPDDDQLLATFYAPAGTEISAYRFWRRLQQSYGYNYRALEINSSGYGESEHCFTITTSCRWLGSSDLLNWHNSIKATRRTGVKGLEFRLTCGHTDGSGQSCDPSTITSRLYLPRIDVTLLDRPSPIITSTPSGPLVDPGRRLAGVADVSLSASDRGGGVYMAWFEVDGRIAGGSVIDGNDGLCRAPFTVAVPCKPSASNTVGFDTSKVRDGVHRLRILVTDATGTNTAFWGPVTIRTANAHCDPFPRVKTLRLRAQIVRGGHSRGRTAVARYGRPVTVRGQLLTRSGSPVPSATLCVASRADSAGQRIRPDRTLVTDSNGRFSYSVGAGPSRRIWVVHRVTGGAVSSDVVLEITAPVSLAASPHTLRNGQTVSFTGRLLKGPIPRRGVLVEMQAQRPGGWQTFAIARTNARGRFRSAYTFTRTAGVQRYQLRARVPQQPVYPYASGASRPVAVTVAG